MADHLTLKWGTLKSWDFTNSPEALEAFKKYNEIGSSDSAMFQKDTPEQKELICKMIDSVNGPVANDWDGTDYEDLQDAKDYVMNYGKPKEQNNV